MWQQVYQQALNQQFQVLKERNPRFSMRSFAKRLGLSIATLSEVMSGKATLSERRAIEVMEKIGLTPELENQLLMMLKQIPKHQAEDLNPELYKDISSWQARSLLFSCHESVSKSEKILEQELGIAESEFKEALSFLLAQGFLLRNSQGDLVRPKRIFKTTDGAPNEDLKKMHRENLKFAEYALDNLSVEQRDFTFVNLSILPKDLEKIRAEIRQLHARILTLHQDSAEAVPFQVAVQAYPIRQRKKVYEQNH